MHEIHNLKSFTGKQAINRFSGTACIASLSSARGLSFDRETQINVINSALLCVKNFPFKE